MKKISVLLLIASVVLMFSCKGDKKTTEEAHKVVAEHVESKAFADGGYIVLNNKSVVAWEGTKAVGDSHNGTIQISAGKFMIKEGKFLQGKMNLNLTEMTCLDLKDAEKNSDLIGHLSSEDFFDVAKFPTASIVINDASDLNNVKASVTIKGITNEEVFPLIMSKDGEIVKIQAVLTLDRTKYGVKYNSKNFFKNLGDKVINDEITLKVDLQAKKR